MEKKKRNKIKHKDSAIHFRLSKLLKENLIKKANEMNVTLSKLIEIIILNQLKQA